MSTTRQKLYILHTNDIHSHFEQMPKIASAMDALSEGRNPAEVLKVDCGDHLDRVRMETEGSDGLANVEIMNETGYEAAVLGNNEGLTLTAEMLAQTYGRHAHFTVLGSNMYKESTGELAPWMAPYHIIQKGALRIGLIGVTADFSDFYKLLGWDVREPFQEIKRWVHQIRSEVHVVVVLSHLGLAQDRRMAEQIEGLDCILGGHSHHLLEEPLHINNTHICAAGKHGQYVGELVLEYDLAAQRIHRVSGRCVNVAQYVDSPRIVSTLERHKQLSKQRLSQPITSLKQPLHNSWDKESPLGNLLAGGLRSWTNTEIGLVNAGQIGQYIAAGVVTLEKLLEVCPSPINPCRLRLTGEQIWQALEESLLPEYIEKPIRGFGFRGKVLGALCIDGLKVQYDPLQPSYRKIISVWTDRGRLEKKRSYTVGTIDMFTFRVGYTSLSEGRDVHFYLPEFIRDILHQQLLDPMAIHRSHRQRWLIQR